MLAALLVIPSLLPFTLFASSQAEQDQRMEAERAQLERRLARLEDELKALQRAPEPKPPAVSKPKVSVLPAPRFDAARQLPDHRPPRDPLVMRIHRRLALVETVIRWRREAGGAESLAHHASGMGVVYGPQGDLLVAVETADPWTDATLQRQREEAQRKGGEAQVLYRVWGSGLRVLSGSGRVNAQDAMVFDQPLRQRPMGNGLLRLENIGFPGEETTELKPLRPEATVLGFGWPESGQYGLPEQTRPRQMDLALGVRSPGCAGCFLFNDQGQLVGVVNATGDHQPLARP